MTPASARPVLHPHRSRKRGPLARFCRLAALLSIACPAALAQSASPTQAAKGAPVYRIAGTVVNAATSEPLRRASVSALALKDRAAVRVVETDSEGRFDLEGLPAGKYPLTASRRGFRTAFYEQHEEYNTAIVTGEGQETGNLIFRLAQNAVLRGAVTADGGDPVEGATTMLFRKPNAHAPGGKIVQVGAATADDTGAYEFGNLEAGEYLLAVNATPWYAVHRSARIAGQAAAGSSAALDVAYPIVYYDSTTDEAAATPIVLAPGGRETANFTLHAVPALHLIVPSPAASPRSRMNGREGAGAAANLSRFVFGTEIPFESVGLSAPEGQPSGTEFVGVAPGHYRLQLGDPPRIAEVDASASQQIDPALGTPTVRLAGTLRTASGAAWTRDANLSFTPVDSPASLSSGTGTSVRDGRFEFDSLPPGNWELQCQSGGRFLPVVSIATGGRTHAGNRFAVRDRPLSLTVAVAESTASVEGFAQKNGKGAAAAMIVLVPKDLEAIESLARRDQSDSDGSFSLPEAAPGAYTVVAIEDGWELDWSRPEVIARYLPLGVPVTIEDKPGQSIRLAEPVPVQPRR